MTLIVADRVLETTTTTGTGALALAAAKTGFRRFSAVCTTGDTCYYAIQAEDTGGTATGEWETGLGTYSAANTLTRTTVHASSNAGSAVNFGAGTKSVWIDVTASQFSGHTHNYIPTSEKGAANGVAPLGTDQKIAATYLPSYVDDVVEVANYAALPGTGETGKIYTTLDNNKIYRWSGSAYVEISPSPGSTDSVTEGSSNLYFTAARVRDAVLTGLSTATNAVIAATDSVLVAFGKLQAQVSGKQDTLVSGTNIKTINSTSLLGSGNLDVQPLLVSGTNIKTVGGVSILGVGDVVVGGEVVIATGSVGTGAALVLGSIPQTHRNLRLVLYGFSQGTAASMLIRFNGDGSANNLYSNSGGSGSISVDLSGDQANAVNGTQDFATSTSYISLRINDYSSAIFKEFSTLLNCTDSLYKMNGVYLSTTAISTITVDIGGDFGGSGTYILFGSDNV